MKKALKGILCVLSLTLLSFNFYSCNHSQVSEDSTSSESTKKTLTLEKKDRIGIREYFQLKAYLGEDECEVSYISSNKKVATVSSSGLLKGIALGKTTIEATLNSDSSIKTSFELEVIDSMEPEVVLRRYLNSTSYVVTGEGYYNDDTSQYSLDYEENFYSDSYEFTLKGKGSQPFIGSYGISYDVNNAFMYGKQNNEVVGAQYFRKGISDYHVMITDVTDLPLSSLRVNQLNDENSYEIEDQSFVEACVLMLTQNMSSQDIMMDLYTNLKNITINIISPYEFKLDYGFITYNIDASFSLHFHDLGNKENEALHNYLKNHKVVVPETYDDITKVKELSANHNFYCELGTYTKEDKTSISMGKSYYTEDYCFIDYSDEYIEETKETYTYVDNGYINLEGKQDYEDGVYEFTASKDEENNIVYTIGDMITETGYLGLRYLKYYDYVENLALIMDQMQTVLYSFEETSTDDYENLKDYKEYASWTTFGSYIAKEIFSDLVSTGMFSPMGIILSINYDEQEPSNTKVRYGGLFDVMGNMTYYYSDFEYTGFGKAKVESLDNFLASLPNKN